MKMKKKKPVIFIFLIVLIVLYFLIYIIPKVSNAFVTSYVAQYGQLTISDETTGYLVRKETVYTATDSGEINQYVDEGTLVRKKIRILEINEGSEGEISDKYSDILNRLGDAVKPSKKYRSSKVGIVSYYADGYESTLKPANLTSLTYEDYSKLSDKDIVKLSRKKANAGEPVYKIVDRTKWYVVCYVDPEHKDRYKKGTVLNIEFEDQTCEAAVYGVYPEGDRLKVVLRSGEYYENFAKTRVCDVRLVTYDDRGLLVMNRSITEENGVKGVKVKTNNDKYVFVPVFPLASNGEYTMIETGTHITEDGKYIATVNLYDEIQKNP